MISRSRQTVAIVGASRSFLKVLRLTDHHHSPFRSLPVTSKQNSCILSLPRIRASFYSTSDGHEDIENNIKQAQEEESELDAEYNPSTVFMERFLKATPGSLTTSPPTHIPACRNPVVLCHGLLGFEKMAGLVYFRGIRHDLEGFGCRVYVTTVPRSASIATRAAVLKHQLEKFAEQIRIERRRSASIDHILKQMDPVEHPSHVHPLHPDEVKFNLIGHSMGGLDARYLVGMLGGDKLVSSITTVATPHHGSSFADYVQQVGKTLNVDLVLKGLAVDIGAFEDLTTYKMKHFNEEVPRVPGVSYFSLGAYKPLSSLPSPNTNGFSAVRNVMSFSWPFLSFSHVIVHEREGPNDGLVSVKSAKYGEYLGTLKNVDHLDCIGLSLNYDARNIYRNIVHFLYDRGF